MCCRIVAPARRCARREGSTASRIAFAVFENVIRHCDVLVDLHTGSAQRTNLPQIRADLDNPKKCRPVGKSKNPNYLLLQETQ